MARYSLQFKKSVAKDLRSLPRKDVQRILKRIESLAEDPRPPRNRTERSEASRKHRLIEPLPVDSREVYRIRQGRYRILYEILDDVLVILVIKVGSRDAVYR